MQHSVNDNAVKLNGIRATLQLCVRAHCIKRYVYVTAEHAPDTVVERYNIRVIVMVEKLTVNAENGLIVTKYIRDWTDYTAMVERHPLNPRANTRGVYGRQVNGLRGVCDWLLHHRKNNAQS